MLCAPQDPSRWEEALTKISDKELASLAEVVQREQEKGEGALDAMVEEDEEHFDSSSDDEDFDAVTPEMRDAVASGNTSALQVLSWHARSPRVLS